MSLNFWVAFNGAECTHTQRKTKKRKKNEMKRNLDGHVRGIQWQNTLVSILIYNLPL